MSLLLSNYRKRRYKSGRDGHKSAQTNTRTSAEKSEFDEYGTELHPDARVWKVYVQETDKFDAELVKVWNDSTDVILIFAALFSAISTAFLIESLKMLQPDPVDVSARTLSTISQTLLALANGTQPSGSITPPEDDSTDFAPSRTAVCVNMLWFLSLSLSLATSFIAILSKDWCHAFMSGRTGHPYSQTCRRQQKWDMLEQWKMSELLAILPSMIHVALLLFSVGLCILLWDVYSVVALPVICISGLAFGFYIWSSATAIVLDFFPYPTVVSKLCRTEPVQLAYRFAVQSPRLVLWAAVYIGVRPFKYVFDCLYGLSVRLSRMTGFPRRRRRKVHPHLHRPAYFVRKRLKDTAWSSLTTEEWIGKWLPRPEWTLKRGTLEPKGASQVNSSYTASNHIKGLALSWLITNCEVPRSVDVALQSIAGAGQGFVSEPLLKCNPTLEILRRLASSNLYRDGDAETAVLLYSRALSLLGTSANESEAEKHSGDSLEVLIWNMQIRIESNVADLIASGQFQPKKQNLDALRIGNTAASRSLRLLRGDVEGAKKLLDSITNLMEQHLSKDASLHPAALLSLVNATTLLLLFYKDFAAARSIRTLCMRLAADDGHGSVSRLKVALIACAVRPRMWIGHEKTLQRHENSSAARAIQSLIAFQSHDEQSLTSILEFGQNDLWDPTWVRHPDNNSSETAKPANDNPNVQFLSGIHRLLLRGDEYDKTPSHLIDILHSLHPFLPINSELGGKAETENMLIGSIWNLGEEFERKLASLISDGTVNFTQSNLEALRLGNDMALIGAKILKKQLKDGDIEGIVKSIVSLLKSHLDRTGVLHDAALLSVTYAAALLCLISPTSINARQTSSIPLPPPQTTPEDPLGQSDEMATDCHAVNAPTLPSLCRQLARDNSSVGLITVFAKTSLLWFNMHMDHTRATLSRTDELAWKVGAARGLIEICSEDKETLNVINDYIESLVEATPTLEQASKLDLSLSQLNHDFLSNAAKTISTIPRITPPQLEGGSGNELQEDVAPQVRALLVVYCFTGFTVLSPAIYVLVVEVMCRTPPSSPLFTCGAQMLSKCPFPTLSEELTTALEQRDLVPLLETTSTSDNLTKWYFAQGQLWLLLSLYIYAGDTAGGRDKLKMQLGKRRRNGGESEEDQHRGMGQQLDRYVGPVVNAVPELGFWAWRLKECVHQFSGYPIWERIHEALRDVPPELRGLSSFTAWPQRAGNPPTNEPRPVEEVTDGATNVTTEGEGATGGDSHLQSAGLIADIGEAGTQGEDDAGQVDSSQELEAATQGPPSGDEEGPADVHSQEEVDEVRGEGNSGVEAVGDQRRVADADDATEAANGPQSEDEEVESDVVSHDGGKEGDVVIEMDRLETRSDRSMSGV